MIAAAPAPNVPPRRWTLPCERPIPSPNLVSMEMDSAEPAIDPVQIDVIRLAAQHSFALGRHFNQALAEASLGIRNPQERDVCACQTLDIRVEHEIAHEDSVFAIPVG